MNLYATKEFAYLTFPPSPPHPPPVLQSVKGRSQDAMALTFQARGYVWLPSKVIIIIDFAPGKVTLLALHF